MELANIEKLLEKYKQGETNLVEEQALKRYFLSNRVAPHLESYQPLFDYFEQNKKEQFKKEFAFKANKTNITWLSIAASVIFFGGIFAYINYKASSAPVEAVSDLGTFDNPEVAFEETQKALALLSENVNNGIEGIIYLNEFEKSKNLIFKK